MRGGRLLLVIGIIGVFLAVVVGGFLILRPILFPPEPSPDGTPGDATPPPMENLREIIVAAQNIPRGTMITEENFAIKKAFWPENALPPNFLAEEQQAYGRIAKVDIVLGMPITEDMLVGDGSQLSDVGSDAALLIPQGRVGYAIAVAGNASVAWAIQPGDHVDALISFMLVDLDEEFQTEMPNLGVALTDEGFEDQEVTMGRLEVLPDGTLVLVYPGSNQQPRLVTQLTVQNARVLRIGSWAEEPVAEAPPQEDQDPEATPVPVPSAPLVRWVTLAVTPQEAAVLKYSEEVGASIDFVLRSVNDHDERTEFTIQAVTIDYILTRYSIELPPKLPYALANPELEPRIGAAGEISKEEGTSIEYSRNEKVTKTIQETTPE